MSKLKKPVKKETKDNNVVIESQVNNSKSSTNKTVNTKVNNNKSVERV